MGKKAMRVKKRKKLLNDSGGLTVVWKTGKAAECWDLKLVLGRCMSMNYLLLLVLNQENAKGNAPAGSGLVPFFTFFK